MKRIGNVKTTTYDAGFGFRVDIVETVDYANGTELYEVWIHRPDYGVKDLMYGLSKKNVPTIKGVLKIIEANLLEHMRSYDDEYCDDDVDRSYDEDFDDDIKVIPYVETEEDVREATELKKRFAQFVREHFADTKFSDKVEGFLDYAMNNYGTGWWVGMNKAGRLFDMVSIAENLVQWNHMDD